MVNTQTFFNEELDLGLLKLRVMVVSTTVFMWLFAKRIYFSLLGWMNASFGDILLWKALLWRTWYWRWYFSRFRALRLPFCCKLESDRILLPLQNTEQYPSARAEDLLDKLRALEGQMHASSGADANKKAQVLENEVGVTSARLEDALSRATTSTRTWCNTLWVLLQRVFRNGSSTPNTDHQEW